MTEVKGWSSANWAPNRTLQRWETAFQGGERLLEQLLLCSIILSLWMEWAWFNKCQTLCYLAWFKTAVQQFSKKAIQKSSLAGPVSKLATFKFLMSLGIYCQLFLFLISSNKQKKRCFLTKLKKSKKNCSFICYIFNCHPLHNKISIMTQSRGSETTAGCVGE